MSFDSTERSALIDRFLTTYGWGNAARTPLGQDASTRRYIRLAAEGGGSALLMDAPPIEADPCPPDADEATRNAMGWNAQGRYAASRVDAFALIAGFLRGAGLGAPRVLAHDTEAGLALIEDFGEGREFARLIERGEADETELYVAAAEALAHLHQQAAPAGIEANGERWPIQELDALALRTNAEVFAEWLPQFDERMVLDERGRKRWESVLAGMVEQAMAFPRRFTLRDYHAENLLLLPHRKGVSRVGLLDFQDAVLGWDAWDLAMLTQDARRAVSPGAAEAAIARYVELMGDDRAAFDKRLAVIGALNALRITGLFARLVKRDGKPRYLEFMPRQQALLARNLAHPAAAEMAEFVRDTAPFIFEAEA